MYFALSVARTMSGMGPRVILLPKKQRHKAAGQFLQEETERTEAIARNSAAAAAAAFPRQGLWV